MRKFVVSQAVLLCVCCVVLALVLAGCDREEAAQPLATSEPLYTPENAVSDAVSATDAPAGDGVQAPVAAPSEAPGGQARTVFGMDDTERRLYDAMSAQIHPVGDEDWGETVTRLRAGNAEDLDYLYQLEGVYTAASGTPSVVRTMVNGPERTLLGLPLKDLSKNVAEGAWVRVTGILRRGDETPLLEVVAIEGLAETGQAELAWTGPSA